MLNESMKIMKRRRAALILGSLQLRLLRPIAVAG